MSAVSNSIRSGIGRCRARASRFAGSRSANIRNVGTRCQAEPLQLLQKPGTFAVRSFDAATILLRPLRRPVALGGAGRSRLLARPRATPRCSAWRPFSPTHGFKTAICDLARPRRQRAESSASTSTSTTTSAAVAERSAARLRSSRSRSSASRTAARSPISAAARHELPARLAPADLRRRRLLAPLAAHQPVHDPSPHRASARRSGGRSSTGTSRAARSCSAIDDIRDVHAPLCLVHVKNDWLSITPTPSRSTKPRTSRRSCTSSTSPATTTPTGSSTSPPTRSIRSSAVSSSDDAEVTGASGCSRRRSPRP